MDSNATRAIPPETTETAFASTVVVLFTVALFAFPEPPLRLPFPLLDEPEHFLHAHPEAAEVFLKHHDLVPVKVLFTVLLALNDGEVEIARPILFQIEKVGPAIIGARNAPRKNFSA